MCADAAGDASWTSLPLTGERTVPGIPAENYWFRRHEAAYEFAAALVHDKRVVEVGCGEGYGTAMLARDARLVVGLDYDTLTAAHASRAYPDARFVRGNLAALPIQDHTVDVVATLQVVEHVWDHGEYLRECRRVLRDAGVLIMTTPNRLTFSPGLERPMNPFHTVEFTAAELTALLERHGFAVDEVIGVHAGPRLREFDDRYGSFVDAQLAEPPESWPSELARDVLAVETADFSLVAASAADIDECLDLVLLARPR